VTSRILVCPFDRRLLETLRGWRVVLRLPDAAELGDAIAVAGASGVELHCVAIESDAAVSAHPYEGAWKEAPIALHAPRLGPFRELVGLLPRIRKLDIRIFLPTDDPESLRSLRILSSLDVPCGLVFGDRVDWEELADLMTYALLPLVPNGPISPFAEVAERYTPKAYTDFGHVYFDDPSRYLHLGEDGRVALSAADVAAGEFLADRVDELNGLEDHPAYRARVGGWRSSYFLDAEGCASCPGFRVCLGRVAHLKDDEGGCSAFFAELMDVVEQHQTRAPRSTWQP
jgi:hypothetical protein